LTADERLIGLGKPSPDVFAKVSDSRLDEYRYAESLDLIPFYRALDGEVGPTSSFRGRPVVMLGSNNYLGLTTDPRVRAAAAAAIERYGTGVTGSRLLNGTLPLHGELEELLADWVGMEAALVYTTGYSANLGLIGSLVGPGDAAVVDSAAHASLVDGARFSEGSLRAFRHNRPNSLRRTLRSWREQPGAGGVLVAVDGIYSMEGDWAPLVGIAEMCRAFGARLLVDEAHALGVVGPRGAGTAMHLGVRPDVVMGTFSKSLASGGGFVAGPAAVIEYLKVTSRPLMFTASGVPSALAAALEAARIAQAEDWRRQAVQARAGQLRRGLADLGFDVGTETESAIVPVHIGDDWAAGRLWKALLELGVYANCAIAPAVPRAMLRTSVMATHSEADIDRALQAFARARG
jgi:8-amino-7-oxononanoate synthase